MSLCNAIPVVIGVGDFKNRSLKIENSLEPIELMLRAIQLALIDTGTSPATYAALQARIDSIDVVATWTWNYPDLPALLAHRLGAKPKHKRISEHGGNSPAMMFDMAARRISDRSCELALITGGEALASLAACAAQHKLPPPGWSKPDLHAKSISTSDLSTLGESLGTVHKAGLPIHVYALYENAYRARRGQTIHENNKESARLYATFARVAEKNADAWNFGQPAASEAEIGTVGKKNRMICFPYTLQMCAFNAVNLAAACLLCSAELATELGVPESKWVYPLSGAGYEDSPEFWLRPNYSSSPSIERALCTALNAAELESDQIDIFDFYSCFPIVPKLACNYMSLPISNAEKTSTLLGGLTSFGGAGNNYSLHSITAMTRELRKREERYGLILANGGLLTYQHALVLSNRLPCNNKPYPHGIPVLERICDIPIPDLADQPNGEATIETYTVEFNRGGEPLLGIIIGRLKVNDQRFLANHGDQSTLVQLGSGESEPIGRKGRVIHSMDGRNLFFIEKESKL